tara:strand:+ start:462 stop:1082 length:621 start_codon:yes stop_codon:yes gene_type:complete
MAKSCPDGQYYCFDEEKCKPIPEGHKVRKDGELVKCESFMMIPLNVEIPRNQTEFDMGLMFRESLEQNSGMLFVFEDVGEKFFHMKDTMIPLDVAFINEEGIVESIKQLHPLNTVPVSSDADVLYALEVNRGWFAENKVEVGDKILEPFRENVVTIEKADGGKYADITDIIGPANMEPVVSDTGLWKGTKLTEEKTFSQFLKESKQ